MAVLVAPATVFGQGNVFNPYGNSGYADYREFAVPMYNNNPALPGQARIQSTPLGDYRRANQFEQYMNRLDDSDVSNRRTSAPGVPYFQAYRRYDEQFKRVYSPSNSQADVDFNKRMKERDDKYTKRLRERDDLYNKAMREKDPAKRAQLLRQFSSESALLDRVESPSRTAAPGTRTAQPKPRTTAPAPGTPSRSAAGTTPRASSVPYPAGLDPSLLGPSAAPRRGAPRSNPTPATTPAPAPATSPTPAETPSPTLPVPTVSPTVPTVTPS